MVHNTMDEVQLRQQFELVLWMEANARQEGCVLDNERDLLWMFPRNLGWSKAFLRRTHLEDLTLGDRNQGVGNGFGRYSQVSNFGAIRDVGYHCLGCDNFVLDMPNLVLTNHFLEGDELRLKRVLEYGCGNCQTTMFSFGGGDSFEVLTHGLKIDLNALWGYGAKD
jgi:hypothetical protein